MKFSDFIKDQFSKKAFISSDALKQAATQPPMDPNMAGGAMPPPPPPPPGPGMDPSMAGGMPPMDPNAGMTPPPPPGGDPSAAAPAGPSPDEIVNMLEEFSNAMKNFEQDVDNLKQEVSSMKIQFAESMTTINNVLDILNKGQIQTPKAPSAGSAPIV